MAFYNMTSEQKNKVPLLQKYQCRYCKKFKHPEQFSSKELNTYRAKVAMGKKLNSTTAELRCRACAGEQVQELQCGGPCNLWKYYKNFSASSRGAGGSNWCEACILWKQNCEPGLVDQAPPGESMFSPDEVDTQFTPGHNQGSYVDPEMGDDDDDDDDDYDVGTTIPWVDHVSSYASSTSGASAATFTASNNVATARPSNASSVVGRPSYAGTSTARPSNFNVAVGTARQPSTTAGGSRSGGGPSLGQMWISDQARASQPATVMTDTRGPAALNTFQPARRPPTTATTSAPASASANSRGTPGNPWANLVAGANALKIGDQNATGSSPSNLYGSGNSTPDGRLTVGPTGRTYIGWGPDGTRRVESQATPTESDTGSEATPAARPSSSAQSSSGARQSSSARRQSNAAPRSNDAAGNSRNSNWAKPVKVPNHKNLTYTAKEHQQKDPRADDSDDDDY